MSTSTRLLTAEDLWAMPNNERRELIRGELHAMAPAGFDHGRIGNTIAFLLTGHVRSRKLGVVVTAETGFLLARNPDIVRGADAAFVQTSRIPSSGPPLKYFEGPPDLAVEVVSPNDTLQEVEDKVADYLNAGTRMVWVANPRRRTVTVHRPGANPVVLREDQTLEGQDLLPDFQCPVAELFA